jgi:signal transduction histidine kinase
MATNEILGARERLQFEALLQWLRLSFLLTPLLVLASSGPSAGAYAVSIAIAVAASYAWVALLLRFKPGLLLRLQLLLRALDCVLVYIVLVNYHAFLHDAYYDSVYLLFVVAAAATHGQRGAWTVSLVAGAAVLVSRVQLIASGAMSFAPRHLTDVAFYTLLFLITSTAVAFLMHRTADVVAQRERALGAQIAARNVELEQTAHELARAVQLRDAMLAGVTHDLRSPVTVIRLQAQLLRRHADERLASSVDQIERAATRMGRWIDELLEVASTRSAEDLELKLSTADLVAIVRDVVGDYQQGVGRHTFQLEAEPESIIGTFDIARIERVMHNLVGNAVKYSPRGGCVSVAVHAADGWASVTVRDEGLGIPAEDLPHIFEPFWRGAQVVGHISGTGIGLANTQRIVERHGGTVSADSVRGEGSVFTVRLPLKPPIQGGQIRPGL